MPAKWWYGYLPPVRDPETGCLRWQGPHDPSGYGRMAGLEEYAHRAAHVAEVGPIPDGYEVDHVYTRGCRFKDCVEPTHLEAVTQLENLHRRRWQQVQ